MFTLMNNSHQMPMNIIHPGEYLVSNANEIIATVLGSCVSVVLHDPTRGYTGMNHFMLAKPHGHSPIYTDDACRYGMYAMEELINSMLKVGCNKANLQAKVFGGGHVIGSADISQVQKGEAGIPESNIQFALEFLELEGIPVISSDVGGFTGRKILAFAQSFRVLLKRLNDTRIKATLEIENAYLKSLQDRRNRNITYF